MAPEASYQPEGLDPRIPAITSSDSGRSRVIPVGTAIVLGFLVTSSTLTEVVATVVATSQIILRGISYLNL